MRCFQCFKETFSKSDFFVPGISSLFCFGCDAFRSSAYLDLTIFMFCSNPTLNVSSTFFIKPEKDNMYFWSLSFSNHYALQLGRHGFVFDD